MANVGKISSNLMNKAYKVCFEKPMLNLQKANFMQKGYDAYRNDKQKFMDWASILSIIAKDGIGCVMYVWQSLNNKNIPDDKRKFVAALDLTNGGLMIVAQIIMHMTISNKMVQAKMFNKMFGQKFDRNAAKIIHSITKNMDKYKGTTQQEINEYLSKNKDTAAAALTSLTSLLAATTIGKRVIVPFIATPLASNVEKWMNRGQGETVIAEGTKNNYDEKKQVTPKSVNKIG